MLSPQGLARRRQSHLSRFREDVRFGKTLHHVEGVIGGHLRGWVFRPGEPGRRFWIAAETAECITYGLADIYRADVQRANRGSQGYCGFAIPLRTHPPGATRVMIVDAGCLRLVATVRAQDRTPTRLEMQGDLRFALHQADTRLAGWLWSVTDRDDRRRIVLRVDGEVVSSQVACLYRQWPSPGAEDDFHGFSIAVPAAGRQIELLDAASGRQLYARRR